MKRFTSLILIFTLIIVFLTNSKATVITDNTMNPQTSEMPGLEPTQTPSAEITEGLNPIEATQTPFAEEATETPPPIEEGTASTPSAIGATPPPDFNTPETELPTASPEALPPETGFPQATPEPIQVISTKLPPIAYEDLQFKAFVTDVQAIIKKAEKTSGIKSIYGVFVMDLKTNYYTGVNQAATRLDPSDNAREGYFNSASVIKMFQGYIICDMLRNGELDENKIYWDKVTGRSFRLMKMIHTMIARSDNNYSNACMRLLGNARSNEVLNRLGIKDSVIYGEMSGAIGYSRTNNLKSYGTDKRCARLTPQDAGLLLYNVYKNKDTDPYMKAMNAALLGNIYNSRIPVGIKKVNSQYVSAHKTGTNSSIGVYNDAGIIYSKHPYILVAFTQGTTWTSGHAFIRTLSKDLTLYFDNKTW